MSSSDKNQQTTKRILVLGSAPHSRSVAAYTWDNLPNGLNVADYDVVILNLVPLENEGLSSRINIYKLPDRKQFARLIFSQGSEVIIIGRPGIKIGKDYVTSVPWWLPIDPNFTFEMGQEIREVKPQFKYYFQHVRSWSFHTGATSEKIQQDMVEYLQAVDPEADTIRLVIVPLAQTRFHHPIAFRMIFQVFQTFLDRLVSTNPRKSSSGVIWLPPTTEISDYEAVNLILREKYRLLLEQTAPNWVEIYKLPNQLPIEVEIDQHEQEIQRLGRELEEAQRRLQEATRFQKLLYGTGEDVLEPVVRDVLRELGAQVTDPPPRQGREDGRLVDPAGRNEMLEVKGRTGALRLSDVRQLDQWVRDAMAEGWIGKGVLIANLDLNNPPDQRNEIFPSNCIKTAERFNICLMTTTQLFNALCAHQRGELDLATFWDTIFNTSGVCPLPEPGTPENS